MQATGDLMLERIYRMREYQVVKSNMIIENVKYNLTVSEQKFLLYSISKIKPNDELNKKYQFSLKEFCDVVGINYSSGANIRNIKKTITNISGKSFFLKVADKKWELINWFNRVIISEEDNTITLSFGEFVNQYLLNLTRNFTQYKLLSILPMKSTYSIRLYELLKANQGKRNFKIVFDVDELEEKLMIKYSNYKDFKKRVLDKAVEEINYYSDIKVDYETIREGRNVKAVGFIIRELSASERYLNSTRAYESLDKK
jgi:plasmid replication initiation protein